MTSIVTEYIAELRLYNFVDMIQSEWYTLLLQFVLFDDLYAKKIVI